MKSNEFINPLKGSGTGQQSPVGSKNKPAPKQQVLPNKSPVLSKKDK
jgi:hypothetical protein